MPYYDERVSKIEVPEGEALIDLLINCSFYNGVLIKVCRLKSGEVKIYWNYEMSMNKVIIPTILNLKAKYDKFSMLTLDEVFKSEAFRKEISGIDITYSKVASTKLLKLTEKMISDGLPSTNRKYHGLDGHNYSLTIYGSEVRKYELWAKLPSEYELLKSFIDEIINITGLSDCYRYYPVDKK